MKRHTSPPPSLPVSEKQRPALLKRLLSGTILMTAGFGCLAQGVAQDRIALVVGIGDYQHIAKSGHAVASSRLVAEALKTAGYEVTALEDLDIARLDEALAAFRERVDRVAKAGLFYFAGHAIEYEGENYLLPTDISADTAAQLKRQAVSLSATLKDLEATKLPAKMVVLDSCRENPLKDRPWLEDVKKEAESVGGLAAIGDADFPSGTMILYAAAPGKTVPDASQSFATAFAKRIRTPGPHLFDAFMEVVEDVDDATGGEQIPWLRYDGAGRVFRELPTVPGAAAEAPPAPMTTAAPQPTTPEPVPQPAAPSSRPGPPVTIPAALAAAIVMHRPSAAPEPAEAPTLPLPQRGYYTNDEVFLNGPYQTYNPAARREILKIVQILLGSGLDGQMGSRTQEAILDFQTQEGLVPTGLLDSPTIALLGLEGIEEDNVVAPPPGIGRPLLRRAAGGPSINLQKVSRVPGKVVRKAGKKIRRLLR